MGGRLPRYLVMLKRVMLYKCMSLEKKSLESFKGYAPGQGALKNEQPRAILINEPGLYRLIFGSILEIAEVFQDWVCEDALPSIRKYGYYKLFDNPKTLTFKIENEYEVHMKVIDYIPRFYPEAVITAGLRELQDTCSQMIAACKNGYKKGQPDLIIQN